MRIWIQHIKDMSMLSKFFRIFIALLISVCVISSGFVSTAAFATTPGPDVEGGIPEEGGLGGDVTETPDDEPEDEPEKEPEKEPEREPENEPQEENNNPPVVDDEEEEEETTEEETTEEESTEVADGPFKVYLELNGGTSVYEKNEFRLEAPGLLPVPEDPTKVGYLFDGWYRDSQLTQAWDFEIDVALAEMTLYAKWIRDPDAILYNIIILDVDGGKITVRPEKAAAGETVLIMIQPEEGMRLKKGSLVINGTPSDILSFVMPAGEVVIDAEFEVTPVEKKDDGKLSSIVVAVVAVVVIGVVVAFVIINKRRNAIIVPEFDEDGALIIEDNEEVWIDESIVVESGFQDGKKASDINPPKIEDFDNVNEE